MTQLTNDIFRELGFWKISNDDIWYRDDLNYGITTKYDKTGIIELFGQKIYCCKTKEELLEIIKFKDIN